MKTKFFLVVILVSAFPGIAFAQAKTAPAGTNAPPPAADASLHNKLPTSVDPAAVLERIEAASKPPRRARLDGPLARAARAGQPWQALNPFAPPKFGHGHQSVAVDPHTHQPSGIVLVSIWFGGAGRGHR